ncbi:extracellular solute-binding protein [Paenibacillus sp. MMS20-IR301]|uniref:ABC transporter substrate-binding protein n=1 Tax=Paenibacillus sp. MMS20-IR301 TaxID=2895946 RepID=UPI0028E30342|nr:extracellular solute-binding protein [Paenibacillus sp. MMS20-IR301]WNS43991.1 extracellular solute-binding protein [Paenibacillus sp. MMS20-IR301]
MFKAKRKLFIIVPLLSMLVSGCGADNTDEGAAAGGNGKGTNEAVTIKLSSWYAKKMDNWDVVIAEFEKQHPDIKVEFASAEDNNSNEYYKKLDLAVAGGDDLDILMFSNMTFLSQRAELGMIQPLDDYLAKDGINYTDEYTSDARIGGKAYGLPGKSSQGLVILNENHLKEAGLTLPKDWTYDEYMKYAKALTKTVDGKTRYGTYFHSWIQYGYLVQNFNQAVNANLTTDDGKTANIDNPYMRKSFELRLQGESEGSATPYAEVVSQKLNYRPQYFNQDTSMLITGSFLVPETGGTDTIPATFRTVFAPVPKMNAGDPISANVSGDVLSIYSKSKHKDEAYTFIRWFSTEGIVLQGKNIPSWKKADLNDVVDRIIAGSKNPDMIDKESLLYVLENTKSTTTATAVSYHAELEKVLLEEFDKMMLSGQDIDTTINNAQTKIQKIIDSKS